MVRVFLNFNSYLGGGETLLVRLVDDAVSDSSSEKKIKVISSKDSYIFNELKKQKSKKYNIYGFNGDYDYFYLNERNKSLLIDWLRSIFKSDVSISIITFSMRDLYIAHELAKLRPGVSITHLLLHPIDHLFMCQSILDKIRAYLFGKHSYSLKNNFDSNVSLLSELSKSNSLIPMNKNVLERFGIDTGILLSRDKIIPLPVAKDSDIKSAKKILKAPKQHSDLKKIVWVGRVVNFKIPAIKTMIDFVSTNEKYQFDIIGSGSTKKITNYIKYKNVENKVFLRNTIPYTDLKFQLKEYDIGYAMGTSMVDLTLCGLPVVVALASPNFKSFPEPICAGLLNEQKEGNVGDDLYVKNINSPEITLIKKSLEKINNDRNNVISQSLNFVQSSFSIEQNISKYRYIFNAGTEQTINSEKEISVNIIRKIIFRLFKLMSYLRTF